MKQFRLISFLLLLSLSAQALTVPQTSTIYPAPTSISPITVITGNYNFFPVFSSADSLRFDSLFVERLLKESQLFLTDLKLDSAIMKADSASLVTYFVKDTLQMVEVRMLYGSIFEKHPKQASIAEDNYIIAIALSKSIHRMDLAADAMDCLFHYYNDRKNYEKALGIYRERESLLYQMNKEQESLIALQLNDSISNLNAGLRNEQKALMIQKDLRSMFQLFFYVAAGVVLLLLIVLFVILSRNAKKRKQLQEEGNQSVEQEKTNTLDKEKLLAKQTKELNKSEQEIDKLRYLIGEQLKDQNAITQSLNENLSKIISESRLQLELIGRDPSGKLAVDKYMALQNLLTKASNETRNLTGNISTVNGTLAERIESLCNSYIRTNLRIDVTDKTKDVKLNATGQSALLNAMNEILDNIDKHSDATQVSVVLSEEAGKLTLRVDENGRGFDVKTSITKGTGIRQIIAIMTYLDGDLDIVSDSKKGTHYVLAL